MHWYSERLRHLRVFRLKTILRLKRWITYRFSYALSHNDSRHLQEFFWKRRRKKSSRHLQDVFIKRNVCWERTWPPLILTTPPYPAVCVISRFSTKSIIIWISLGYEKATCIFKELLNLHLIVLLIIFIPLVMWLQQKIETSWSNYLFELQSQAEHNTPNIQTAPDYSSATAIMLVIFWTERRIHSTTNLKTYKKVKNFFNPANTQSSSEWLLKEKRHKFIDMCSLFTWFNT